MGVQSVSFVPAMPVPTKIESIKPESKDMTIHVKYNNSVEKILVSPETTSEEISRALLSVCGFGIKDGSPGVVLALYDTNGHQLVGQPKSNDEESAYSIRINNNADKISADIETLRRKVMVMDMDKVNCDGSLYILADSEQIYKEYYTVSAETAEWFKSPTFNNWEFQDNELVALLMHLFKSLEIPQTFDISDQTLFNFISKVRAHYNHNHGFCVTQMAYSLIHKTGFVKEMTSLEKLILLTACLGHDLDHPGYNNAYQVNAKTDLAIIYNDQSPLENHHSAIDSCNILKNLSREHVAIARKGMIRTIMATDMAKHGESVAQFNKIAPAFSLADPEHRGQLVSIFIKCADISTEVRPPPVADIWVNRLLEEFFCQSDREKAEGLPFMPFMDRLKVTKAGAQTGFLGFCVIPLYEALMKVYPVIETEFVTPIRKSLEFYKGLEKK